MRYYSGEDSRREVRDEDIAEFFYFRQFVLSIRRSSLSKCPPPELTDAVKGHQALRSVGVTGSWWSQVREQIRRSEYHVSLQPTTYLSDLPSAYHAPNRAHNLRTYFTAEGIRVIPRASSELDWEWGLKLMGYGHPDDRQPLSDAVLSPEKNRIVAKRRGDEESRMEMAPPRVDAQ